MIASAVISFCILLSLTEMNAAVEDVIKFFATGDQGGIPIPPFWTPLQLRVAEQMAIQSNTCKPDFIVSCGDNFYETGVRSATSSRFQTSFENVYTASSLFCPWLMVLGNHDYLGNVNAQIEHTKLSSRWYMPNHYYERTFTTPISNTKVKMIIIDTQILCGYLDPFNPLGDNINETSVNKHLAWIESALQSASDAHYVFLSGHYPVYSTSSEGSKPCMLQNVLPLLQRYNVTAYIAGHDHTMEHLYDDIDPSGVHHIITGAANFLDPFYLNKKTIPPNSEKFKLPFYYSLLRIGGFVCIEIKPDSAIATYIDSNGKILHNITMKPRI